MKCYIIISCPKITIIVNSEALIMKYLFFYFLSKVSEKYKRNTEIVNSIDKPSLNKNLSYLKPFIYLLN